MNNINNINNPDNPVVLFIPEAGIYPYMRGLAILGDAVRKRGGRVLVTHDTGQMLRTPIMDMYRLPADVSVDEKEKINKINDKIYKSAQQKYKFSTIELSELVDSQLMKEIDNLDNVPVKDLEKINFRGFPVGKIAQHDFILATKSPYTSEVSEVQKSLYLAYIKNTALTVAITDRICKRFQPSLIITFNEYAQCQAVRYSATINNISRLSLTYPVHFGIDTSRFSIGKSVLIYPSFSHCQKWNSFRERPITQQSVKECWDDVVFRLFGLGGSHIYSSRKKGDPASIFNELKLDPRKKTIVVYTSSSDERHGMDVLMNIWKEEPQILDVFSNQIEWISWLRNYASRRNDIQIVVRIHPREGSRQFGFDSPHLKQLKAVFAKNAPNFYIIWPDDQISSYDLMELADACLVSWSTIGQEAARIGIPTLACAGNMTYPDDDFIQVATTPEEYKRKLDSILEMQYLWQHLVKAVRFYHWRTFIPSLDLGETVPRNFNDDSVWPEAPASKVGVINDILSGKQDLIEYNIKQWQDSLPADAAEQETTAMRQGIRLFLDKIFYPPRDHKEMLILIHIGNRIWRMLTGKNIFTMPKAKSFNDYCLKYSENIELLNDFIKETKKDSKLRVLVADGAHAILIHDGKILRRMSPLVIRLAKLHQNAT